MNRSEPFIRLISSELVGLTFYKEFEYNEYTKEIKLVGDTFYYGSSSMRMDQYDSTFSLVKSNLSGKAKFGVYCVGARSAYKDVITDIDFYKPIVRPYYLPGKFLCYVYSSNIEEYPSSGAVGGYFYNRKTKVEPRAIIKNSKTVDVIDRSLIKIPSFRTRQVSLKLDGKLYNAWKE